MSLKKKVTETKAEEKLRPTVEEELEMLASLEKRICTLQGAKIGAEGLAGVLSFLEEQGERELGEEKGEVEHVVSVKHLASGLYEVAGLLHATLLRDTNAMEREIWDWKRRLGPKAVAQ